MPTITTGNVHKHKPAAFEIKSADLPLIALVLKSDDVRVLESELFAQFGPQGSSPDFFNDDAVVIDYGQLEVQADLFDLERLLVVLRGCKLLPVAVRNATPDGVTRAKRLGLVEAQGMYEIASQPKPQPAAVPVVQKDSAPVAAVATMVVDKPIRSGQKIYARGCDLVLLSMVNRGAEVVADGNIHVYAALRGKAMAGAKGNTKARIFALAMEAELVSIAGVYRTAEKPFPAEVLGKATQVRLSDDGQEKLLMEPLKL